jgi:hypothetical protein
MILSKEEDILNIVKAFEDRTISRAEWTHAAHLLVGLYYCRTLPFPVARNVMRDGVYWLNDRHGVPNTDDSGYHETLTVFWLKRIWNFLDERPAKTPLIELGQKLLERYNDPELPLRFYSREVLFSNSARADYVPPDLRVNMPLHLSITVAILRPMF